MQRSMTLWFVLTALVAGFGAGIGGAMVMLGTSPPAAERTSPSSSATAAAGTHDAAILHTLEAIQQTLNERDGSNTLLDDELTARLDALVQALSRQPAPTSSNATPGATTSATAEATLVRIEALLTRIANTSSGGGRSSANSHQLDPDRPADAPEFRHLRSQRLWDLLTSPNAGSITVIDELDRCDELLSSGDTECYALVRRALRDERPEVANRALEMLNSYSAPPSADDMGPLLATDHDELRRNALEGLASLKSQRAAEILLGFQPSGEAETSEYAYSVFNILEAGIEMDPPWPAHLLARLRTRADQYPIPRND